MNVLFFAQSREAAGFEQYELKSESPLTQDEMWSRLIQIFPQLAAHRKTARLARNESYLQEGELIQPGDEVAIIPPVSGG